MQLELFFFKVDVVFIFIGFLGQFGTS
uniref:Uncharacterized protein n=1 Tax=Anguilla anguilla TaxID=7936 RepID=A0A0E9T7H2_ANGAN